MYSSQAQSQPAPEAKPDPVALSQRSTQQASGLSAEQRRHWSGKMLTMLYGEKSASRLDGAAPPGSDPNGAKSIPSCNPFAATEALDAFTDGFPLRVATDDTRTSSAAIDSVSARPSSQGSNSSNSSNNSNSTSGTPVYTPFTSSEESDAAGGESPPWGLKFRRMSIDELSVASLHSAASATSSEAATINLKVDDVAAYDHLRKDLVVDGVTRRAVTNKTKLAALYSYEDRTIDNELVKSMAGEVRPAIPCQLETPDGAYFPPNSENAQRRYHLHVTFANLYLAPVVRLICRFTEPQQPPYLTLKLDFHFNDHREGEDSQISSYNHEGNTITFHAGRATCSGFNLIDKHSSLLGEKEHEVVEVLRSFLEPDRRNYIQLHLFGYKLSTVDFEHLNKIRARLPGGAGHLLPSIGQREYAAFGGKGDHIPVYSGTLLRPGQLMSADVPVPMVPLPAEPTFSSLREAAAQLAYSTALADEEQRETMRLWSAVRHDARLLLNYNFPVLALYFRRFDTLGARYDGTASDVQFRLPHDLACDFTVKSGGEKHLSPRFKGFLLGSNPGIGMQGGRKPDALFRITSHVTEDLRTRFPEEKQRDFMVSCSPHVSSFSFNMQLEAVRMLQGSRNSRWWPILLNQNHDELPIVDPSEGVSPQLQAIAETWLRHWQKWNPEQMEIIDNVTRTKGGMTVVMGPAATGKTLLQRGIAIYYYALGYHILALAPANDNVNKLAKDLVNVKKDLDWIDLDFNRLFPSTRDVPIDEMSVKQAGYRKIGHEGGNVLPFNELLAKLDEDPSVQQAHREYGIVESVIRAADETKLSLRKPFNQGGVHISHDVETWDVLRQLIAEYREDRLNETDHSKMELYRKAYQACKAQIVGLNRFMITTTGNVRATEMRDYWFSRQEEYGVPRKGVVILVDEAAKDVEVNIWSAIVSERWCEYVKGVWLFGDDKQLQPTNVSSKGRVQFNYFSERLDMALPNRLVMEGFPHYRLYEQRRMHEAISEFPNAIIYDGKLRNGPGMDVPLDTHMVGLRQVLMDIIANELPQPARTNFMANVKDNDLRRHYIEVIGKRVQYERSSAVHEHIDVFMESIFPKLFDFFRASGRSMRDEVMIICAYNFARSEYDRRIKAFLMARPGCTTADVPRILSVDASQGDEAFMVFLDASAQHADAVGFMASPNRFNVAITRAKGVLWMIGGNMSVRRRWGGAKAPNLMTQYKRELEARGQCHRFKVPETMREGLRG